MSDNTKKIKVMFSTHGLVEGDFGFNNDEYGNPTTSVIAKKVITGQDTGGQVYYVKALAISSNNYDTDLVTRRVDSRICPQFGGTYKHYKKEDLNYTIEQQWHESEKIRSRVLRVPAGGNFEFIPKEEIMPVIPELIDNLIEYYKLTDELNNIEVVEGHYRDGMMAANIFCDKIEEITGRRPIMLVTSHSLGHKKYERNLPKYQAGDISEEEWMWHNFEERINHEQIGFNKADIIIATSPDEEQRLSQPPYLCDMNKVTVIPPGYNDKLFKPLSAPEKNKLKYKFEYKDLDGNNHSINLSNMKVVSSLGRVVRDKGFSELSRSMSEIMAQNPDVIFMVSGENNNPVTEECKNYLKDFKDRVIFLPSLNQSEMARIYNVSDIFVMSSLNEAFGMVPIEAMGCETAVIVGRSGFNDYANCADVRNDNIDYNSAIGLYAPSQEQDRWRQTKALNMLLNDDKLRHNIASNGLRFVKQNLTWEQISNQKDILVQKALQKSQKNNNKKNNKTIQKNIIKNKKQR